MKRMKQVRSTVQENNEAFIAKTMEEFRTLVKPEQKTISEMTTDQTKASNEFLALLNENTRMLNAIDSKVAKFSNEKVQELLVPRNLDDKGDDRLNLKNSSSFVELEKRLQDLTWWSKASLIATATSTACFMFYVLSK